MALSSQTASSSLHSSAESSSSAPRWKHDMFLSFRGEDTRKGITSYLYYELQNRGIKTFMDDQDLVIGTPISPSLLMAIEESRFAVVVLSQNYASSTWCLEELAKIVQCMKDHDRILPLFYDVEPSDVRYQNNSYEFAFTVYEEKSRHDTEKLNQWRAALTKVANLSGWDSKKYKSDRELVKDIVKYVCSILRPIEYEFALSTGDFEAFEATIQAMSKVMKALKDDEVTAVGVYGMAGVGKTTMVKHVGAQAFRNEIFDHVIMAVVTQRPDLRKIQGTLADLLDVKLEGETEIGRADSLSKEIARKNKILIILDDIWERMDLSTIGIPSYDKLKKYNSKVLLTTRIRYVCHAMGCREKIALNVLSKDDSWTFFVRNTGRTFDSTNFHNVATRVASECCGLPIALIAVARALGDKDLVEWEKAAQRLKKSQTANPNDKEDVYTCIKLSYDYLRDEDSKSCFLLSCLFPEDCDIPIEELFKYAFGKGLFRDVDTIEEARGRAVSVVKYLKDSSLLLDSEYKGYVRMHDVIRDTALNIAKSEDGHGFLVKARSGLKHWSYRLNEGYSAISLMQNKLCKLPEELVCPKLHILLLQDNQSLHEIPETFFQSLNELRVLNVSRTSVSLLPQSFSFLTNLQALYLDSCTKIINISILGKLKKLEILSMRNYNLEELPREIGLLTNLRMLDVRDVGHHYARNVTIPSEVISKLHRLEELYMLYCGFDDWGRNLDFDELTGLSNLKILQVCIPNAKCIPKNVEVKPNWVYFNIHIGTRRRDAFQYDHNSRSLKLFDACVTITMRSELVLFYSMLPNWFIKLVLFYSMLPNWFINVVTAKTEELVYHECEGLRNILIEYDRGRLYGLKFLTVCGPHENLKELINTTTWSKKEPVFENLEELHVSGLDSIKELCVGELPPGSLFNLKVLMVDNCQNLGNVLLPSKLLHRLPNLEMVNFYRISEVEYVFGCERFEPEQSKLREMKLLGLDSTKNICNGPAPQAMFQTLKSLFIYHCRSLGSLFTSDAAQSLFQLEDLWVEYCDLLERVIEASKETVNNKKTVLPKLKNLLLCRLPMLYNGGSATIDIECPSLEHLFLEDCPQFSFSTSASASDYFGSRNRVQLNNYKLYFNQYDSLDLQLRVLITKEQYLGE